jgi:hypothetical protein
METTTETNTRRLAKHPGSVADQVRRNRQTGRVTYPTFAGRPISPLRLGRKAKPTLKHRPAIWECMLGTVYARNADGETRYFDYRWEEAAQFAGLDFDADNRVWRNDRRGYTSDGPAYRQFVLYVPNITTKEIN